MGRRGPPPLPTAIKRARGTLQKCRTNPAEPQGSPGIPPAPAGLDARERREWVAEGERLHRMGVLSVEHQGALMLLVKSKVQYLRADAQVKNLGAVVKGANGLVRSPWVLVRREAWAQYKAMCQEFGATPSAATRVRALKERQIDAGPAAPVKSFFGFARSGQ